MPPAESGRGSRCVRRRKFAARKRENAVRHRGLRLVTPSVARATGTWPHRTLMPPASSFITPRREQLISCRLKGSSISASVAPEGEAAHVPPQLTLRRPIARQPLPSPTRARKGADRGVRRDRSGLQQGATCGSRRRGAVAIVDVESASDAGALRKSRLPPPSSAGVRRHRIPQIFSKTNFINPSFEQRHRMTYAIPCGHGFFLVAEEFLANVLRATGGAKPVLRTMPR